MIAVGIGCRRGTRKAAIARLVREALDTIDAANERIVLVSIEDKQNENGLIEAALDLQWPLRFLPRDALRQVESAVRTPSRYAEAAVGVISVSEAAALAGAGCDATLLVPRISGDGVTCAVARGAGQ